MANQGKKPPNWRLLEAAMAVLQASPGQRLNITVLNKALFYLDLLALRDHGETITRAKYIALPQGPCVAAYDRKLVRDLKDENLAEQTASGMAKPVQVRNALTTFEHISETDRTLATRIAVALANKTSSEVSEASHGNPGWAYAHSLRVGHEVNMLVALQELGDCDPWLEEPISDEEQTALKVACAETIDWS